MARYTNLRAMAKIAVGQLPGPGDVDWPSCRSPPTWCAPASCVSSLLGPALIADTGAWGTYAWSEFLLGVPGMRVAGGTDEVLHNIIGERVLGLPKEPAPRQPRPVALRLPEGQLVDEGPRPPVERGEPEAGQGGAVHRRRIALVAIEVEGRGSSADIDRIIRSRVTLATMEAAAMDTQVASPLTTVRTVRPRGRPATRGSAWSAGSLT